MTSQQIADQALDLWRANKRYPDVEALLDEYFGIISAERYADQLRAVSEEMSCPTTLTELSA